MCCLFLMHDVTCPLFPAAAAAAAASWKQDTTVELDHVRLPPTTAAPATHFPPGTRVEVCAPHSSSSTPSKNVCSYYVHLYMYRIGSAGYFLVASVFTPLSSEAVNVFGASSLPRPSCPTWRMSPQAGGLALCSSPKERSAVFFVLVVAKKAVVYACVCGRGIAIVSACFTVVQSLTLLASERHESEGSYSTCTYVVEKMFHAP